MNNNQICLHKCSVRTNFQANSLYDCKRLTCCSFWNFLMWEAPPVRARLEVLLNLGTIHASLGVNIRNSLFPCLILFCSFLLDAWTLLRGFGLCHWSWGTSSGGLFGGGDRGLWDTACPDIPKLSFESLWSAMVECACLFLSHSTFVGGSWNAGPFGSSQDLRCYFFNLI